VFGLLDHPLDGMRLFCGPEWPAHRNGAELLLKMSGEYALGNAILSTDFLSPHFITGFLPAMLDMYADSC